MVPVCVSYLNRLPQCNYSQRPEAAQDVDDGEDQIVIGRWRRLMEESNCIC